MMVRLFYSQDEDGIVAEILPDCNLSTQEDVWGQLKRRQPSRQGVSFGPITSSQKNKTQEGDGKPSEVEATLAVVHLRRTKSILPRRKGMKSIKHLSSPVYHSTILEHQCVSDKWGLHGPRKLDRIPASHLFFVVIQLKEKRIEPVGLKLSI